MNRIEDPTPVVGVTAANYGAQPGVSST